MLSKIEHELNEYIKTRRNIEYVLEDAARAERFLAAPNNKKCPSMYQLLETYYNPNDWGYHVVPTLKLRATPRQMTHYNLAIDILSMVDDKLIDNPLDVRKIIWLRATKNSYSRIGKYLGYNRTTVRRMYDNVLDKITLKIMKESIDIINKKFN